MSAPVKRTVSTVVAAMVMGAFSTFLAITLSRLFRHHHTESDSDSDAATSQGPTELRPDA